MNFIDKLKEKILLIKEKIFGFFISLYNELKNIENKKRFAIIVGAWIAVFISVIIVSKIKERHDKNENLHMQVLAETDSLEETTLADIYIESVVAKKEIPTESSTQETSTDIVETEKQEVVVEKETIAFEELEIVDEQLYDDAVVTAIKNEVIYSEPGEKKSSKEYDEDRFVNCIDVSKHQGDIDWSKVKASGIDYAIIRVAYRGYETGKIAKDSKFEKNIKEALANDIEVGVYFFSQAINEREALEEASVILNYIKGYNITLPVVIDWETAPGYRTYSGIGKSELTDIISVFCDTVSKYGYDPMVYMCQSDFTGRVYGKKLAQKYKIWVAWYFECYAKSSRSQNRFKYGDEMPDLTYDYNVWQYSKKGYVNGISTDVDMNLYILPEKKPHPILTVDNERITLNINSKNFDIYSGVKLIDSDSKDATDKVKFVIKNQNSKSISINEALLTAGKYSITYFYEENPDISKTIDLYVRDVPKVYFDGILWDINENKSFEYFYNNTMTAEENIEILKEQILSKIEAREYDITKKNEYSVINGFLNNTESLIGKDGIMCGKYELEYVAEDSYGLRTNRIITVNILDLIDEEDESETEKSLDETEENKETEKIEETEKVIDEIDEITEKNVENTKVSS